MEKCRKCSEAASTEEGLCYRHLAEILVEEAGCEEDVEECLEWMKASRGPEFGWFARWFDGKFAYGGSDREEVYSKAYTELRDIVSAAYEAGFEDGMGACGESGDDCGCGCGCEPEEGGE